MPNHSNESPADSIPTWMAIAGTLCVFLFLFLPLPQRWESDDFHIYLASGKAEAIFLLLGVPAIAFLIYLKNFVGALVVFAVPLLYLLAKGVLAMAATSGSRTFGRSPEPGLVHWAILIVGLVVLIGAEVYGLWQTFGGRRGPITLSGSQGSRPRAAPSRPAPVKSSARSASRISLGDFFQSVDWGWWGIALLSLLFWPLGLLLFFAYSRAGDDKGDAAILGAGLGLGLMVLRFVLAMAKVGTGS